MISCCQLPLFNFFITVSILLGQVCQSLCLVAVSGWYTCTHYLWLLKVSTLLLFFLHPFLRCFEIFSSRLESQWHSVLSLAVLILYNTKFSKVLKKSDLGNWIKTRQFDWSWNDIDVLLGPFLPFYAMTLVLMYKILFSNEWYEIQQ